MSLSGNVDALAGRVADEFNTVRTELAGKAATSHTHDDRYYTESEVDTALSGKSNTGHTHAIADTTGLQTALDGKAASSHTHTIANVTGLQTALDGKQAAGSYAAASHGHAAEDITSGTLDAQRLPKVVSPTNSSTESGPNVQLTTSAWNYKDITATGNLQFLAPTTDIGRQILQVAVLASGAERTITFEAGIEVLTGMTRSYAVPSGELLRFSLEYSPLKAAWVLTAVGMTGG